MCIRDRTGGEAIGLIRLVLCVVPAILLLTSKQCAKAVGYICLLYTSIARNWKSGTQKNRSPDCKNLDGSNTKINKTEKNHTDKSKSCLLYTSRCV